LTILALGCWTYDSTSLTAVSRLIQIDSTEISDNVQQRGGLVIKGTIKDAEVNCGAETSTCTDSDSGIACVIPFTSRGGPKEVKYGSCRDGECVQRCTTAADCDLVDNQACYCPVYSSAFDVAGTPYLGQCATSGSFAITDSKNCVFPMEKETAK
jgi:hypothetical protein